MSIYKDNPALSVDFEIQPFEIAFSIVIEKYRGKVLDNEARHYAIFVPAPICFVTDFNTIEKRLYMNHKNGVRLLGRSNTQHMTRQRELTGLQGA